MWCTHVGEFLKMILPIKVVYASSSQIDLDNKLEVIVPCIWLFDTCQNQIVGFNFDLIQIALWDNSRSFSKFWFWCFPKFYEICKIVYMPYWASSAIVVQDFITYWYFLWGLLTSFDIYKIKIHLSKNMSFRQMSEFPTLNKQMQTPFGKV